MGTMVEGVLDVDGVWGTAWRWTGRRRKETKDDGVGGKMWSVLFQTHLMDGGVGQGYQGPQICLQLLPNLAIIFLNSCSKGREQSSRLGVKF